MITKLHNISEYTELLKQQGLLISVSGDTDALVGHISYNSMDIKDKSLFVCKGAHFSEKYLHDAIKKGSIVYVSEKEYELPENSEVTAVIVNDIRSAMGYIANLFYNNIWDSLHLTGITGTKGKSSTAYFVKYILDDYLRACGKPRSAIISGIDNYDGVINEESHLTTPETFELHQHFLNAVNSGIEYLTMEVSSQALKYGRTLGVMYEIGCFLNIGEDHISGIEHPDFNDYFHSKLKLFSQCRTAVVNLNTDCEKEVMKAASAAPAVVTFGIDRSDADIYGYDVKAEPVGISFKARCDSFDEEFRLSMKGLFNADNALAAVAIARSLNIPVEHIKSGLKKARVSGRMEVYTDASKNLDVIVDYAHNKMSFETLFQSTRKEYPGRKISIVFGCPGKKALGRRKELGEIAGRYSDHVFITEEDGGEESVTKICREIAQHVKEQHCSYDIIEDRREAIKRAIDEAGENAVVLITGKGRETRQKRGTQYIDTPSDVEYVEEFLNTK